MLSSTRSQVPPTGSTAPMIDENLTSLAGHPEQTDSSRRPSSSGRSSLNYPISDGNLLPFAGLSTATSRGRVYAWDVRDHPMRLESEAPRQSLPMCPSLLSFCDGSVLPDFGLTGPDQGNPNAIYFDQECPESGFELRSLPIAALGSPMPHGGTTIAAESDIGQRSSSVLSDSGDNATAPRSELPSAPSTPASSPFAAETQDDNPITATQRINHNNAEKKYRMSIKDSFAMLRDSIPSRSLSSHCSNGNLTGDDGKIQGSFRPACKLNKATILRKATEYIHVLESQNAQLGRDINELSSHLAAIGGFSISDISNTDQPMPAEGVADRAVLWV